MRPAQLQSVEEIFHAATECALHEIDAFLDQACAGDAELRGKVAELLAAHREADGLIDRPIVDLAASINEDTCDDSLIGETIGCYKIVERIGAGGMGAVYLAERADAEYQKQVAIKLIKRGMDTDSVLRHFRNERQILASFEHPNIARLLDGGATEGDLPYFVMEYVKGIPIDAYCDERALSVHERLKLFTEICSAVAYAHRHAVIHRDIKPSNILVATDGTPKLLNFGVAKMLQAGNGAELSITLAGQRLMTPEFASPEQVRGEPVTTATDVYSLGVVLYQLLTGEKPYRLKTRTVAEISRAIVEQEPLRPSTATARRDGGSKSQTPNPKVLRGDLDNIVLMALRKEAGRRYQSVEQFADDIQRYLERRPIRAQKDTIRYRAAKFVQRNRVATSAAALLFISLLAGIVATTWEARRARKEEAIAKEQKARAERRFNDVRHLAHSVLFDYHDAIKDLPGATRVRERLVKDALVYLDSLASEAEGDAALQRELAGAYDRVGDVRGQAYGASLGDRAGAMDSYLKALRIREALARANPKDMQSRRELAESHRKIGWQMMDTTEGIQGLEHLRKAVDLDRELKAENPENADLQYQLSVVQSEVGMALYDRGDLRGALDQYYPALALQEKLLTDHPRDLKYRRALARTDDAIGRALGMAGDIAGALEANHKGLVIEEESVAEDPTNGTYRRGLEISYANDGYYRDRLGDKRGAIESYRKSIAISEQLVVADPSDIGAADDLAQGYQQVGDSLAALGDNAQALLNYRKSLKLFDNLLVNAPEDLRRRLLRTISRAGVGKIQARLGQRASAVEECRATVSLLRETREDPANSNHRSLKAQAYQYLGEAYVALATFGNVPSAEISQHWTAARDMFQRSSGIYEDMRSRGIFGAQDKAELDEITRQIAQCDTALKKSDTHFTSVRHK